MKTFNFKIKSQYINLIKNNIKKHEYRLNTPINNSIEVNDILLLVSNDNSNDYVHVKVTNKKIFKNWDDALKENWKNDFLNIYNNYEELYLECNSFYTKEQVDKYGIIVFDIELKNIKYEKAKYLFDTNIIALKELFQTTPKDVEETYRIIDKIGGIKFIHNVSINELYTYNKNNKFICLEKAIKNYYTINDNDDDKHSKDFCSKLNNFNFDPNDIKLLFELYQSNVDFIITDNIDLIENARLLKKQDRVFTPTKFLELIENYKPELINYDILSVKLTEINEIDINDSFFDSLREDYGEKQFNNWFYKKRNEKAYVFKDKNILKGFLYIKIENKDEDYSDFDPILLPKKRLKVGTFKIDKTGLRLGERFLKIIFDNAIKNDVDEIYVTMFTKKEEVKALKKLFNDWGFIDKGYRISTGEVYLVKDIRFYDEKKDSKFNYPLIKDNASINFLPILADYHTKLFPDLHLKNEDIHIIGSPCGYAIEKFYITKNINLKPGTLLCVYRMANYSKIYRSVVTGLCVLNKIIITNNKEAFISECKNKTVFSEEELANLYVVKKYNTIIKILFLKSYNNKINYKTLKEKGICNENGPRLHIEISKSKFDLLEKIGEYKNE